ncbi:MAG: Bcr/CflA family drug resistance efflux transporter [Thermoleophilia bacterium]|nr:Bcr/CflA family drug resistance efflux transporter [Thermoleophilia bacterium]
MTDMSHHPHPGTNSAGRVLGALLCLLTIFGPVSMDLYLPMLPSLTMDLGSPVSVAQLTISACLLGLALGRLVAGPMSDRFGRRIPLLVGVVAYIATSLACAWSASIEMLIVARFAQGLAGSVGIVIAQAAGRDIYSGGKLMRYYGRLTVIGGVAAIAGPLVGGLLANVTDWRGAFVFLAALGAVILVASIALIRETLPADQRRRGGLRQTASDFRELLATRKVLGAVLITGFTYAAVFAYLSGATFVLQGVYELTPLQYSYAFGLNSLSFVVFGFLSGRLCDRWSEGAVLRAALAMCATGALLLLATSLFQLPLAVMLTSLVVLLGGVAAATPPATSLALADHSEIAGTASSLLGVARFAFGGLAAPLVGMSGNATALGIVTAVSIALAWGAYRLVAGSATTSEPATSAPRLTPTSTLQEVTSCS